MIEEQKIDEIIKDNKNGVVCWFYVYKKNDYGSSSICGIVIIKQLTDNNKIFFYTKTNFTLDCPDGPSHGCSDKYENDDLIYKFIATEPTDEVIQSFFDVNKTETFILGNYSQLPRFLNDLIKNNFEMFENSTDDESIRSSYSIASDLTSKSNL